MTSLNQIMDLGYIIAHLSAICYSLDRILQSVPGGNFQNNVVYWKKYTVGAAC